MRGEARGLPLRSDAQFQRMQHCQLRIGLSAPLFFAHRSSLNSGWPAKSLTFLSATFDPERAGMNAIPLNMCFIKNFWRLRPKTFPKSKDVWKAYVQNMCRHFDAPVIAFAAHYFFLLGFFTEKTFGTNRILLVILHGVRLTYFSMIENKNLPTIERCSAMRHNNNNPIVISERLY